MAEVESVTNTKLITCVLPKGKARQLQQALVDEHGINTGTFHYGRGIGRDSHIRDRGIGEQQEREIFEVVVDEAMADEIFEFIFFQAEMSEPHGGIIYQSEIPRASVMRLPELPDPESDEEE
jgi:nitrogen regulatory protein PII